ncbi:MAG: ATP phosphoribosyltransferase regulatory subunit [Candidatus Accumulibacter sp.]|uniref:ATP phosphoribosyltransferase regulatory subunit n=1 Tax=Accumulibacter sp. TaxID=2053492 RepID=UPI001D735F57|nr:ATP phosphoribosyltransferase regulatory subunit [Accumulibacter sp.]MCB1942221.1 ATP phosphoribosyltransferase regulatory subunit [Accumulibacter sp.]MCP5249822.1 ATP phosphoribosyltransferase regulatory subunit [Accumulibacter sp.]
MNWLLPEHIADALPAEAAQIERLRRRLLDLFRVHGYELVMPPLLEHLDSLLTGSGQDLKLRTFKLVDQLSGRTLGVRADMTPQVARIDAHLLNRQGVTRLCYCDSVLHTLPASLTATREPIQLGAELYGHAGLAADREVIRLMADALAAAGTPAARIDLGHVGVFRALADAAGLDGELEEVLLQLLQAKDVASLRECCGGLDQPFRSALLGLPDLYGGVETLAAAARVLPELPAISAALDSLRALQAALPDLPLSFDLADLRGYHYHNGVVFAAYHLAFSSAIALGGRYDGVGKAFGRERPATGFSMDLRELARLAERAEQTGAIMAPHAAADGRLSEAIAALRARGEVVVERLPGDTNSDGPACDRQLAERGGQWVIAAINRNG